MPQKVRFFGDIFYGHQTVWLHACLHIKIWIFSPGLTPDHYRNLLMPVFSFEQKSSKPLNRNCLVSIYPKIIHEIQFFQIPMLIYINIFFCPPFSLKISWRGKQMGLRGWLLACVKKMKTADKTRKGLKNYRYIRAYLISLI